MSHSPPVPPGNQSPYPIAEPPHPDPAPAAADDGAHHDEEDDAAPGPRGGGTIAALALGAAAAVAATVAGVAYARSSGHRDAPKGKAAKRKRDKRRHG